MSESYSEAELSMAFNAGHNDAWNRLPPKDPPNGVLTDQAHQRYREGHVAGTTARWYFDAGYAACAAEQNQE